MDLSRRLSNAWQLGNEGVTVTQALALQIYQAQILPRHRPGLHVQKDRVCRVQPNRDLRVGEKAGEQTLLQRAKSQCTPVGKLKIVNVRVLRQPL